MDQYQKMDKLQLARTNRYNVLRCLIREGPINRAAIAKRTDLSIPTVMFITEDLLKKRVIRSIGKGESSGGKPPEMLEIVPERFYYIGADVGRTTIRVAATDALSREAARVEEPTGDPLPERRFVDRLGEIILRFSSGLNAGGHILGVGVAMPGLIDAGTGNVVFSPDFGWNAVPLKAWLEEALPYPVMVENANRALAVNESSLPGEENSGHITLAVNLGYGIGAALLLGERLYAGASGTSGEIGHITVVPGGPPCRCGNRGCLEAAASGAAIALRGRALAASGGASRLEELAGGDLDKIDARLVFQAAGAGDPGAAEILSEAAGYIGLGLAMAVNLLDPDRVILCGGLMRNGPGFFNEIRAGMERYRMRHASRALVISAGARGDFSTANGACRVLANDLWWQRKLPV